MNDDFRQNRAWTPASGEKLPIPDKRAGSRGLARIWQATLNSMRSLRWLLRNEAAFRQELGLLVVLGAASFWLDVGPLERCAMLVSLLLILLVETLNTAIETTIDRIDLERHPLSGLAKDLGSLAVFISLTIAAVVWSSILLFQ